MAVDNNIIALTLGMCPVFVFQEFEKTEAVCLFPISVDERRREVFEEANCLGLFKFFKDKYGAHCLQR
jgi:hypothetical protein